MSKSIINVWTDGSCLKRSKDQLNVPGSWAYIIETNDTVIAKHAGFDLDAKGIGRMECMAAYRGLLYAYENYPGKDFKLISDSEYVVKGLTSWMFNWEKNGWKKSNSSKIIENRDVWEKLFILNKYIDGQYKWVKAHKNINGWNDKVDQLARDCLTVNLNHKSDIL